MKDGNATTPLTNEILAELSCDQKSPCLSLYQTTHRKHPENRQDPIRFRNLVKELEASLGHQYLVAETRALLEPFEALTHNVEFWEHTLDGLAVLSGPGIFRVLTIPQTVTELVVVADSFHTKPLRRFLQSVDRYQILGLSLDKIRLFEGNRYAIHELELAAGVPHTIEDALGKELTEPYQTVASYGGVGGASNRMHHGQGGKADEVDIDSIRFFRAVDRAIQEHYSRPSGLPLILAALPEHHHLFHEVSQNPMLVAESIRFNPDSISVEELCSLAWQVFEPRYQARLISLSQEFEEARSKGTGSDELMFVPAASISGRVATLLIDGDQQLAGRLNGTTGLVELAMPGEPSSDDVFDDLGELVASKGGTVLVIPSAHMPSRNGLAAIYRH